jgi:hypothetical protein
MNLTVVTDRLRIVSQQTCTYEVMHVFINTAAQVSICIQINLLKYGNTYSFCDGTGLGSDLASLTQNK